MKLHFSHHMIFQNQLGIFLALVLESQRARTGTGRVVNNRQVLHRELRSAFAVS